MATTNETTRKKPNIPLREEFRNGLTSDSPTELMLKDNNQAYINWLEQKINSQKSK